MKTAELQLWSIISQPNSKKRTELFNDWLKVSKILSSNENAQLKLGSLIKAPSIDKRAKLLERWLKIFGVTRAISEDRK